MGNSDDIKNQENKLLEEYKKVNSIDKVLHFEPTVATLYLTKDSNTKIYRFITINEHPKAKIILLAFASYAYDLYEKQERYNESAPVMALATFKSFLPFLDTYDFDEFAIGSPKVVKAFETYRVNECGLKPQSTNAHEVLKILRRGVKTLKFKEYARDFPHDSTFVHAIVDRTSLSLPVERKQCTLSLFLSQSTWLRQHVGSREYNKISSPKLLINSFSVSIATLMCIVQEVVETFYDFVIRYNILVENLELTEQTDIKAYKFFFRDFIHQILTEHCPLEKLPPEILVIFSSIISQENLEILNKGKNIPVQSVRTKGIFDLHFLYSIVKVAHAVTDSPESRTENIPVSPVESRFFSWLMAWLAVQPENIAKLTLRNFAISEDKNGSPLFFNINYVKGRGNTRYETKSVSASTVEGRAILNHLKKSKNDFLIENSTSYKLKNEECSNKSLIGTTFKTLLETEYVQKRLNLEHDKRGASTIFADCILAQLQYGVSQRAFKMKKANIGLSYKVLCEKPLPSVWFRLTHIKNTAVHASADRYKLSHLVNYNSHSSETEATSYINEYNQNWTNTSGRVTRTVMLDFATSTFRPGNEMEMNNSLLKLTESIEESKAELISRTEVREMIESETQPDIDLFGSDVNKTRIVVVDSSATYLQFANYLFHANICYKKLMEKNPEYVEFTMLPTCEWIEYCLNEVLSTESIEEGFAIYKSLKHKLPNPLDSYIKA